MKNGVKYIPTPGYDGARTVDGRHELTNGSWWDKNMESFHQNYVVIFQTTILGIVDSYVRHSAINV